MKQLIVTADDFGYSRQVNKAIIKCFKDGVVTSISLIANTKYFDESIKLLKQNRKLDVGVHINLTEFRPLTRPKTLIGKDRHFVDKNFWFTGYCENADKDEVEKEIEAQILKVLSSGLKITHINGHNHIHIFPKIVDAVIKLAMKYRINYIRLPYEEKSSTIQKNEMAGIISKFLKTAKSKMLKNKLKTTNDFFGILDMHDMDAIKLSKILKSIPNGTSELMVHPAYIDRKGDDFHQSRQRENEIKLLTDKKIMKKIKKLKINLTNFSKL